MRLIGLAIVLAVSLTLAPLAAEAKALGLMIPQTIVIQADQASSAACSTNAAAFSPTSKIP